MDIELITKRCTRIDAIGRQLSKTQELLDKLERGDELSVSVYLKQKGADQSEYYHVNYRPEQLRRTLVTMANDEMESLALELRNVASSLT